MLRNWVGMVVALQASNLFAEQILQLNSGDRYLGRQTADNSGVFVDCQKKEHKLADGVILPTAQTCAPSSTPNPSQASLITLSPLEVVAVDALGKTIDVERNAKVQTLDLQKFPHIDFSVFGIGKKIGIVTDKKSQYAEWISPDAIFDSSFAAEAKAAQAPPKNEGQPLFDKGS
ncbi:hypothetical protein Q1W70_22470 [Pseudomonas kielensis]|uniref:hypothetical protein n=1 Tax=Pseudomonas TaxID=286 RepID=UPI001411EE9C|nr:MULTISPECIES: hypothetical protein [Pseudomonas]NBB36280.1 hypothetical protein [Pseudomonas sp. BC115LW]UZM15633.1 hypothetical protein LZV00_07765 [Pseudomonas kielensis]WKL52184.1 hypothetical protein Q1W70_22470 [Pseudomonas kielensis]